MTFFEYSSAAEAIESELDFFREFLSGLSVEEVLSFEPLRSHLLCKSVNTLISL